MSKSNPHPRVLAISSGGGHWNELWRLRTAFSDCKVTWCCTHKDYASSVADYKNHDGTASTFHTVIEANRWQKWSLVKQVFQVMAVVIKEKPQVVVSTGASIGVFAIIFAKLLFRARTIWVQSLADAEKMSISGTLVRPFATLWLTQWEHQAKPEGPHYFGSVL